MKYRILSSMFVLVAMFLFVACVPVQVRPRAPEVTSAAQGLYQITSLDDTEYWPRISADGKYLAYIFKPKGRPDSEKQIYISELEYSSSGVTTKNKIIVPFRSADDVAWQPKTNRIVFILGNDIVMYNPFNPKGLTILYSHDPAPGDPAFSPDGTKLAFHIYINDRWWITVLDVKTGVIQTVVPGTSPNWSKDGRYIVYDDIENGKRNVFIWDTKDRNKKQVTSDDLSIYPAYAGDEIIYQSWKDGHWHLFLLNRTGHITQLTRGDTNSYTPYWSPMGYIFFTSNVGASKKALDPNRGLNDIWAMKLTVALGENDADAPADEK